jgi:hypothetical protein
LGFVVPVPNRHINDFENLGRGMSLAIAAGQRRNEISDE